MTYRIDGKYRWSSQGGDIVDGVMVERLEKTLALGPGTHTVEYGLWRAACKDGSTPDAGSVSADKVLFALRLAADVAAQ